MNQEFEELDPKYYMVFDVESIGLHGEGFAFGYVVIDRYGKEIESCRIACNPNVAKGSDEGRRWVAENCPSIPSDVVNPRAVRDCFWSAWMGWKERGAVLVADVAWPVEARFLIACVDDDPVNRSWNGPHPLHEVASAKMVFPIGDPSFMTKRQKSELPEHDPLADARYSARMWWEEVMR